MTPRPFLFVAFLVSSSSPKGESPQGSGGATGGSESGAPSAGGVFELPTNDTPWTATVQGHKCTHVKVEPDCQDGWCRIPAGCFLMGSPEDEPYRGAYTEELTPVELTHSFLIQQTEVTQAQWLELVDLNPSGSSVFPGDLPIGACLEPDCPVNRVTWWSAVEFANRLSERDGFTPCYLISACSGEFGLATETDAVEDDTFRCTLEGFATESIYECDGYRLPTEAEHEYAMRSGTRSAFYSGGYTEADVNECERVLPQLDAIAWYCANSGRSTHPVAQKLANQWGLFDMHGNVAEWGNNRDIMPNPGPAPWVDPFGANSEAVSAGERRLLDGGHAISKPYALRSAGGVHHDSSSDWSMDGFRLVRTLDP